MLLLPTPLRGACRGGKGTEGRPGGRGSLGRELRMELAETVMVPVLAGASVWLVVEFGVGVPMRVEAGAGAVAAVRPAGRV